MNGNTLIVIAGILALLSFGMWSALKSRLSARQILEPELRQPIETIRVQLAALKLANGHMDSLRRYIDAAKSDYRDVLVPAEYPKYWKATSRGRGLSKHARHQLFESDRKRYENWLRR